MVFLLILETTAVLYNLVFNMPFLPEQFNVDRLQIIVQLNVY